MENRPAILILVHENDRFARGTYLLREISKIWEEDGFRVLLQQGTRNMPRADIAVLHVNLTVVPEDYLGCLRDFPRVINGAVRDISKRFVSRQLVRGPDASPEPVIVKTDCNCGGAGEAIKSATNRLRHALRRVIPWSYSGYGMDYRIFPSSQAVPGAVWRNPRFVVERFLPERDGDLYCLRTWTFFGDRETNSISWSREPIVKATNVIRREASPEIPDELRRIRRELGFDYGKFDYVIHEGKPVLYDANRTPTVGNVSKEFRPHIRPLAQGLLSFL